MNFLEITVERRSDGRWPVVAKHTRSGDLPIVKEGWLELRQDELLRQVPAHAYGSMLGQALFRESVRDAFKQALRDRDESLHVLLYIEDKELRTLRWERLCAPISERWAFLLLNQDTPFSLYLPSPTDKRFPPFGRSDLRALIVAASPDGLEQYNLQPFDAAAAVQHVRAALPGITCDVLAAHKDVSDAVGLPSLDALANQITEQPYTLLHVICHGRYDRNTDETFVFAADDQNQTSVVSASELIDRLNTLQGPRGLPQLVFLATCESAAPEAEGALGGLGQRLVRELGMPAVVAMTERVSIEMANALSTAFYKHFREHGEVDRALAEATAGLAGRPDVTVPALFSRLGGRPLFSDARDRELTPSEIAHGLDRMAHELQARAPILLEEQGPDLPSEFNLQAQKLRDTPPVDRDALGQPTGNKQKDALKEVDRLCERVLEVSFSELCSDHRLEPLIEECPFPGLKPFDKKVNKFFFGRQKVLGELANKLVEHNFLVVLGPSGSGKSSLVLAGLMKLLQDREPDFQYVVIQPGNAPVGQLEQALAQIADLPERQATRALLVINQFEELFMLTRDEALRRTFIERLLAETHKRRVVLTMRDDFLGDCSAYQGLDTAMQTHLHWIAPMTRDELRSSITQQAFAVDMHFEAELVDLILDDVAGEPGAMPLLQHGLLELWNRRHGRWLLFSEYQKMGGVKKAIARTVKDVYDSLQANEKSLMRNICLRLVRLDDSAKHRDTCRRATFDELVTPKSDPPTIKHLLGRLADKKLVITSVNSITEDREVEFAHEALIEQWEQLRQWIGENRRDNLIRQQLSEAAAEWNRRSRDRSYLFTGKRLAEIVSWSRANADALNPAELNFLRQSQALKRRQRVLQFAGVAAIAMITIAAIILIYIKEIDGQRKESRAIADRALQQLLTDPLKSLALSSAALPGLGGSRPYVPQAEFALTQALRANLEDDYLPTASNLNLSNQIAFGPEAIAVGGDHPSLVGYDLQPIAALTSPTGTVLGVEWQKTGPAQGRLLSYGKEGVVTGEVGEGELQQPNRLSFECLAAAPCAGWRPQNEDILIGDQQFVKLWTPSTNALRTLFDVSGWMKGFDWTEDGNKLAVWDKDGVVHLWDAETNLTSTMTETTQQAAFVDGDKLALVTKDDPNAVQLWSVDGRKLGNFPGSETPVDRIEISPDGSQIAAGFGPNDARVYEVESLKEMYRLPGFSALAWNDQYSYVAAGAQDGSIQILEKDTGKEVMALHGHQDGNMPNRADVLALRWMDGRRLLSAGMDGSLRLWQVLDAEGKPLCKGTDPSGVARCSTCSREFPAGKAANRKQFAAHWLDDNTVVILDRQGAGWRWSLAKDSADERPVEIWPAPEPRTQSTLVGQPHGPQVLHYVEGGTGQVWNAQTRAKVHEIAGEIALADWPDWQENGPLVARLDGNDLKIDLGYSQTIALPRPAYTATVEAIAVRGDQLAAGWSTGLIQLWDYKTDQSLGTLPADDGEVNDLQWDAQESRLLSIQKGKVRLWDTGQKKQLWEWPPQDEPLDDLSDRATAALSPDGRFVALASASDLCLLDSGKDGKPIAYRGTDSGGHQEVIMGLQWTSGPAWPGQPLGANKQERQFVVTWSGDGTARLWHWDPGTQQLTETWRAAEPLSASEETSIETGAANSDGSWILTVSDVGTLRAWKAWPGHPEDLIHTVQPVLAEAKERRRIDETPK